MLRLAAVPLLWAALLSACATTPPATSPREPVQSRPEPLAIEREELAYLVSPMEGYPLDVDAGRRERVENAYRDLLDAGATGEARATAAELLDTDPAFHPAQVLAAQVDFAAGEHAAVARRLLAVGDQLPGYTASQLLLGRAAEKLGDIPLAYAAFRIVAPRSSLAFQRTGELHPRALEIVVNRVNDALRRQSLEEAQSQLGLLREWAPSEMQTLEAEVAVAVARSDRPAELSAVKALAARRPDDRKLLERRAELELAVGDPSAGLQIVQDLARRNPNDPALAEKLAAAKFRWRLSLLPAAVREVAAKPDLDKADLALLLYWLVPNVHYGRPSAGRIATDVLDHPHQEAIVRVVNLGLMDVDSLHRFGPSAPVRRGTAIRSLARLLARFAPKAACLGGAAIPDPSPSASCDVAARCRLVATAEECQPAAPLSGGDAVELIRRTLEHLGGS
ncbi:MAG TPA: hypothetical protein VEL74_23505 [Thermoanaerobaculia bacterium]|nr:hypothetical protein [Thermoanaerobaculia bacterium]